MVGFPFSPQLLEIGLEKLGIAAAQLKTISPEVKKALVKLLFQAVASGDASSFLEKRLRWIDEYEEPGPRQPERTVRATAHEVKRGVVEGELVDPERPDDRRPRRRR